jgi:uncharacterized protein
MKSWSLLESQKQNKYLYDQEVRRAQLCHPLLHYIVKLGERAIDVKGWVNSLEDDSLVEIEHYGYFSKKDVEYYYRKYLLLKENGYFTESDIEKRLSLKLDEENVKKILANTTQVLFEVTEKCQMNCYYCGYGKFYHDYDKREKKNLDTIYAKTLLNYLLALWNSPLNTSHDKNIYIGFYGGEPLLNFPFITEIVNYVKQLKVLHNHFTFSMTTNGILVEKYMDFLYRNNFVLLISLDGNEENNAFRVLKSGKPTYKTILKNVKALQKKYPDFFLKRVNFIAVLHNKNSVSEIYNFFKRVFNKIPLISELSTTGIKDSQIETFWKTYSNMNESLYQSEDYSLIEKDIFLKAPAIQKVSLFLTYRNDFSFNNYKDLIYTNDGQKRLPTGTCLPFSRKIFVTVNGKILPCERIGHQYSLGSVNQEKVELNFDKIAEKYNAYYNKIRKYCNVCSNTETCVQCIFNLNIQDNNPVCNGLMTEEDHSKYLSSIVSYIEEKPEMYSKILKEGFDD